MEIKDEWLSVLSDCLHVTMTERYIREAEKNNNKPLQDFLQKLLNREFVGFDQLNKMESEL